MAFVRLFCAYAHKDRSVRDDLHAFLDAKGVCLDADFWYDRRIQSGENFNHAIADALERADVFLFLLSDAFLESKYINTVEAERAISRFRAGEALIVPVNAGLTRELPEHLAFLAELNWLPDFTTSLSDPDHRDEAFAKVADGLRPLLAHRNHLLISPQSPFSSKLRSALIRNRSRLRIARVHSFEHLSLDGEGAYFNHYNNLLESFLSDGAEGNCILTIYPDEAIHSRGPDYDQELVKRLMRAEKGIICFESGTTLLAAVSELNLRDQNPVCVIRTRHDVAARELIKHLTGFLASGQGHRRLIMLPGPSTPNSSERWEQFRDFAGRLLFDHRSPALSLRQNGLVTVSVNSPPLDWKGGHEAADEIFRGLAADREETASTLGVICANDEMAIKVLAAYEKHFGDPGANRGSSRTLFAGFDGTDEMHAAIKASKPMVTMEVDYKSMCEQACAVFDKRPYQDSPHRFDARLVPPPF